jgi:hypothetical protein
MNQIQQLQDRLNELKNIIAEAKSILEWQKLHVFENSQKSSSEFFFQDDTYQQLLDKRIEFQSRWIEIAILLENKTIPFSQNQRIEFWKELNKLSQQFYYLGSNVRVY